MMRTLMLTLGLVLFGLATVQPAAATCPADPQAAVSQACPCGQSSKHGQFMKCVSTQLRGLKAQGCAPKDLRKLAKCANSSVCGKANEVVCCTKSNRKKLTTAEKCVSKGGHVATGANSLCEAKCGA